MQSLPLQSAHLEFKLCQVFDHQTQHVLGVHLVGHLSGDVCRAIDIAFSRQDELDGRKVTRNVLIDLFAHQLEPFPNRPERPKEC